MKDPGLNRRQLFDYIRHRLTKSSEVNFSNARLMRIDLLDQYDQEIVFPLIPVWSSDAQTSWKQNSLIIRYSSGKQKLWKLTAMQKEFIQMIDGNRSIGELIEAFQRSGIAKGPEFYQDCIRLLKILLQNQILRLNMPTRD